MRDLNVCDKVGDIVVENKKNSFKKLYLFFLGVYLLCLPLNAINLGAMGSAVKYFAIIPVLLSVFAGGKYLFRSPLLAQMGFTFFAFLSILWSVSLEDSLDRVISYALLLALLISGSAFSFSSKELNAIKLVLAWSSRFTALVMLVFAEFHNERFLLQGIVEEDPNYLCAYLAFGVVYALEATVKKKNFLRKVLAVAELLLYFYLVLISGSRGGLLAIVSAVIVFLMMYSDKKSKYTGRKLALLLLVLVGVLVLLENLPEELRLRFTMEDVAENGGTGRVELWKQSLQLFGEGNWFRHLFGYGTATISWCFANFGYGLVNVAHNMFIETLAELGLGGLFLYSLAIFLFAKAAYRNRDGFSLPVMFCMIVMSLSTSIYTFKPYFHIMLFIVMSQNLQKNPNEDSRLSCERKYEV